MGGFGEPQGNYVDKCIYDWIYRRLQYDGCTGVPSIWYYCNSMQFDQWALLQLKGLLVATAKSGGIAIFFLGVIYAGIAYLGATSTGLFGLFDNGGPVLSACISALFRIFWCSSFICSYFLSMFNY